MLGRQGSHSHHRNAGETGENSSLSSLTVADIRKMSYEFALLSRTPVVCFMAVGGIFV